MKPIYVTREGIKLGSLAEWKKLREDKSYVEVRAYDNGDVRAILEWNGRVDDASVFRDCWPVFKLMVGNYAADGSLWPDPVEYGKTFPTEEAGIAAYEAFIERWTASRRDAEGALVEEDNNLTPTPPPPPPNPDAPASEVTAIKGMEDDDVGAW